MKKIVYSIIFVIGILFIGCDDNDIVSDHQTETKERMLTLTAFMPPDDEATTRIGLEEIPGSLNLSAKWNETDKVSLFFVQGETKIEAGEVPISNISANGKQSSFRIGIPQDIDIGKSFDIYGFSGVRNKGVSIIDGKILADISPEFTHRMENISIPVWFKANIAKASTANLSVNFDHLGAVQITHLKNTSNRMLTIDALGLVSSKEYDMPWLYYPEVVNDKFMQPFFNPMTGKVEIVPLFNSATLWDHFKNQPRGLKISQGFTVSVTSWLFPKNVNLPETALRMILPEGSESNNDIISVNTNSAKQFPMRAGRAYHLYGVWNGNRLTLTDDDFVSEELPVVDEKGLTEDIKNLIPEELFDEIERLGMIVNGGNTPPSLTGAYLISPLTLIQTNIPDDFEIGEVFADKMITFSNQNNSQLTIQVDYVTGSSKGEGLGGFIIGSGNKFTIFVEIARTSSRGLQLKLVEVYSGTLDADGIKDMYTALFMLDDKGDPYDEYIENGQGRLFWDSDGFSEKIYSIRARSLVDMELPELNSRPTSSMSRKR
ncbi:hypothetical protein [Proteiniphilum sp.]|uniref:hypothetical protein n=1 Tax=Proteiniphilum sp. TaxID=1926877 RepID=UPI002B21A40B|nr:hypothetical protein [Proteiniphilum sp.]MEA4917443.1 hypothetical protein [Proteiniphilum sp.]